MAHTPIFQNKRRGQKEASEEKFNDLMAFTDSSPRRCCRMGKPGGPWQCWVRKRINERRAWVNGRECPVVILRTPRVGELEQDYRSRNVVAIGWTVDVEMRFCNKAWEWGKQVVWASGGTALSTWKVANVALLRFKSLDFFVCSKE